jgi:hypothetical protein
VELYSPGYLVLWTLAAGLLIQYNQCVNMKYLHFLAVPNNQAAAVG